MTVFTWSKLIEFIAFLGYTTEIDAGCFQVLALQGAVGRVALGLTEPVIHIARGDDTPGLYNDLMVCVGRRADGTKFIEAYVGTINPGTQIGHQSGTANLTYGQHAYVRGLHKGHNALRGLNEMNRIWRDYDNDQKLDVTEQIYVGTFGTNVHAGSGRREIGGYSLGCLNLQSTWDGADWKAFDALISEHTRHKTVILFTLWRVSDLLGWLREGTAYIPTVYPGVLGKWAAEVQGALRTRGYNILVDGDWRSATTHIVVAFQASRGLKADGIVGPSTWRELALDRPR